MFLYILQDRQQFKIGEMLSSIERLSCSISYTSVLFMNFGLVLLLRKNKRSGHSPGFIPIIPAVWEVKIRKIMVQGHLRQKI
jgi:hypothetical protein